MNLSTGILEVYHQSNTLLFEYEGTDLYLYRESYTDFDGQAVEASVTPIRAMVGFQSARMYAPDIRMSGFYNLQEQDEKNMIVFPQGSDVRETDYVVINGMQYALTNVKQIPFQDGVVAIVAVMVRFAQNFDWSVLPNAPQDENEFLLMGMNAC